MVGNKRLLAPIKHSCRYTFSASAPGLNWMVNDPSAAVKLKSPRDDSLGRGGREVHEVGPSATRVGDANAVGAELEAEFLFADNGDVDGDLLAKFFEANPVRVRISISYPYPWFVTATQVSSICGARRQAWVSQIPMSPIGRHAIRPGVRQGLASRFATIPSLHGDESMANDWS